MPSKRYLLEQTTARTRAILRKYPPLDVMVFTMNAFVAAADILGSRILEINKQIITRLSLLERAARIAKDAAPYVHPRLTQIEHTSTRGLGIVPSPTSDNLTLRHNVKTPHQLSRILLSQKRDSRTFQY